MTLTPPDIFNILQTGRPVSIIRAGDGEKIVLNSNKDLSSYKTCIDNVMKRQMGYEPTMGDVEAIRENLISAYQGADVVGVPRHKNLSSLGKHWNEVEQAVMPFVKTDKICSMDVCYDMLYAGLLTEWLKDKSVVNYIGCRDIDIGFKKTLGVKEVHSFIIAPEAKFTSGYKGAKHYPEQFSKMEYYIDRMPCDGNPCLVGAGVIGKIYCNWFRDRGGVAIDVGAVMDLWAGKATRGPLRGLDAELNTYKL